MFNGIGLITIDETFTDTSHSQESSSVLYCRPCLSLWFSFLVFLYLSCLFILFVLLAACCGLFCLDRLLLLLFLLDWRRFSGILHGLWNGLLYLWEIMCVGVFLYLIFFHLLMVPLIGYVSCSIGEDWTSFSGNLTLPVLCHSSLV